MGALVGILLTGAVCRATGFAVSASPLAQPWSIIGGNIVTGLIGVTCARWITDPLLAGETARALAA